MSKKNKNEVEGEEMKPKTPKRGKTHSEFQFLVDRALTLQARRNNGLKVKMVGDVPALSRLEIDNRKTLVGLYITRSGHLHNLVEDQKPFA